MSDQKLPVGPIVPDSTRTIPQFGSHLGQSVRLAPLDHSHLGDLWLAAEGADASWTYLRYGPFNTEADLADHIQRIAARPEQPFFAIVPLSSGKAEGWASFGDISTSNASIEIGSIWFSPRLQRTRAATEAIYLMMKHAFELGYHRIVWRCNALNAASMRAAQRFGFVHEGTWREAEIVKGRRRDTAWFSILETEWPEQQQRFDAWLADCNFDAAGKAKQSLNSHD